MPGIVVREGNVNYNKVCINQSYYELKNVKYIMFIRIY